MKRYRENPKNKKEIEKHENSEMIKLQKSLWHLKKLKNKVEPLKVTAKGQKIDYFTEDEEIEEDVNLQKNEKYKDVHKKSS